MEKTINIVKKFRFFDIAANLCDSQFQGMYYGKKYHESDVDCVIERANESGVDALLLSSGNLEDCHE